MPQQELKGRVNGNTIEGTLTTSGRPAQVRATKAS
jgi:hypothetical protein